MGSTDRRLVRHYCYCYFRLGKALLNDSIGDRLLAGVWLTSRVKDSLLELFRPEWNKKMEWPTEDKLKELGIAVDDIFPFSKELSEGLQASSWSFSLLEQPDLFIRLRPGKEERVVARIIEQGVDYRQLSSTAISFPAATQLQHLEGLNSDYVVQDYSSQQISSMLENLTPKALYNVWDCCAASGGKSILAFDYLPNVKLLASDVRSSMMPQLKNRLQQAGLHECKTAVIDLEQPVGGALTESIDLLIADVPCSGSGTWGRTPEQLRFFETSQIEIFAARQQKIVAAALPSLRKGGYLLYITCSVFRKENEYNIGWLVQEKKLKVIQASIFDGSGMRADTLFAALLQKI